MPARGTPGEPAINDLSAISRNRFEVASSGSRKTPARNGRSTLSVRSWPNLARKNASVRWSYFFESDFVNANPTA